MTVNTTNITSGPYIGNGLSDTYSYTFRVDDKTQLSVYETTDAGVQTLLTVDTDYTVTGVGVDGGGTVVRTAGALPTNYEWYIRSNYTPTQLTDFDSQGGFFPDVHESAFDKLTFLVQQLLDGKDRALSLSDSIDLDGDMSLTADAVTRASQYLAFDASGNIVISAGTGADAGLRADLASTDLGKGASLISVRDAAANFTASDLETILVELIAYIDANTALISTNATDIATNATDIATNASNLNSYTVPDWTFPELVGSGLAITAVLFPTLATLSSTRVAFIDNGNASLRAYDFDGDSWSLVGSGLGIAGIGIPALAALSSTRVAFIDDGNDQLRAYDFNGSTWSLVGSGLNITTVGFPSLAALSSTRVAFIDATNDELRAYDFNGSTWSLVGSGLAITGVGNPSLVALSSTRVAFIDDANDELRAYDFNGSTWSLVGSGLNISPVATPSLSSLSSTDVALIESTNDKLLTYRFDGSTWSLIGTGLTITSVTRPALTSTSPGCVAFIDDGNDELRTYRFNYMLNNFSGPYHP